MHVQGGSQPSVPASRCCRKSTPWRSTLLAYLRYGYMYRATVVHLCHVPRSPCLGIYVPSPKPGLAHKFSSPLVFSGPPLPYPNRVGCAMVDAVAQRLYQSCTFHTSTLVIHTALPACLCLYLCLLSLTWVVITSLCSRNQREHKHSGLSPRSSFSHNSLYIT